jgi:hypothetical protein
MQTTPQGELRPHADAEPARVCPNCHEITITVAQHLRWCLQCGTLTHPADYQWGGCIGSESTPFLVRTIRENRETFHNTPNLIRERVGLPLVVEKGGASC